MEKELHNLLNEVNVILQQEKIKKEESLKRGERFNMFATLGVAHYEVTHSAIIASFLNPQELHGQGDKFLKLFLSIIGDETELDTANSNVTDLYHKNELFSMLGHQRVTRRLSFMGSSRGTYAIKNASILVRDYFMTGNYAAKLRYNDIIYVFPKKINTDHFRLIFKGILGEIESKHSIVEDSLSFRGIREYQPFDSYRSINWKQSAKARELMVNMYGYTTDSRVRIMLNLDNDYMIETNQLLEEAISLASSIARSLLEKGVMVSIITNGVDEHGVLLPPVEEGAERKHGITIDRMLTEINSSEGKDIFLDIIDKELSDVRTDTLYLVISPYARADILEKLDILHRGDSSVHLIVPCYKEYPYIPNREYAESWEVPLNV